MRSAALSSFLMSRPSWPRRCSRSGSYRIARLAGKYSAEIGLTEPVAHLAAAASYRSRATLRWSAAALISPTSGASASPRTCRSRAARRLAADYSKKSIENGSAFVEKLLGAKSFESAIRIQSEYANASSWHGALCALISAGKGVGKSRPHKAPRALRVSAERPRADESYLASHRPPTSHCLQLERNREFPRVMLRQRSHIFPAKIL